AKNVTVRTLDPRHLAEPAAAQLAAVERLIARWEAARPMPPMGFLVQMHLASELAERRFCTATQGEELVGFLSMVPVFARRGWFVEDLVRLPAAPNGSAELLDDALAAFARGGLLRFGLRTLLRRPAVLIQALALILIPWTILMAAAPSARWFPSPAVKWGWVAFDAALAPALVSLARRWRRGLDTLLATLVSADAAVTLGQVLGWNLRYGPRDPLTVIVAALSVLAPTLAALLLWIGRRSG